MVLSAWKTDDHRLFTIHIELNKEMRLSLQRLLNETHLFPTSQEEIDKFQSIYADPRGGYVPTHVYFHVCEKASRIISDPDEFAVWMDDNRPQATSQDLGLLEESTGNEHLKFVDLFSVPFRAAHALIQAIEVSSEDKLGNDVEVGDVDCNELDRSVILDGIVLEAEEHKSSELYFSQGQKLTYPTNAHVDHVRSAEFNESAPDLMEENQESFPQDEFLSEQTSTQTVSQEGKECSDGDISVEFESKLDCSKPLRSTRVVESESFQHGSSSSSETEVNVDDVTLLKRLKLQLRIVKASREAHLMDQDHDKAIDATLDSQEAELSQVIRDLEAKIGIPHSQEDPLDIEMRYYDSDLDGSSCSDSDDDESDEEDETCDGSFGSFKKVAKLGEGGYGLVYLVQNAEGTEKYAMKVAHDGDLNNEVSIMETIPPHRNIVGLAGVERDDDDNVAAVFLNYVDGQDLAKLVASGKGYNSGLLNHIDIKSIVRGVTRALAHLHRNGIVHTDVKPANILVDSNNKAFLADFGSSLFISDGKPKWSSGITPRYCSPEALASNPAATSDDIWSLGCVMIQLFSGDFPWSEKSSAWRGCYTMDAIPMETSGPAIHIDESLHADAYDFAKLCLNRDPKERPSAEQLLIHPFLNGG